MVSWLKKTQLHSESDSDEALLRAYQNGNAHAFEVLYLRHKQSVFQFLFRQCNRRSVCEELAQESWMAVVRQAQNFTPKARFKTWLYRIAHNKLVDYWRRQQYRSNISIIDELDQIAVAHNTASETVRLKELAEQLESLSAEQLSAVLLKIEGFSYAEIAEITQAKKETVKSRLRYATTRLKVSMEATL